ncbi:hypothetical protein CEQ90_17445 [Lewinellaceae bacterium SD302]|nr:hypothetical protein CEQ90_17445 [Lewinellaceae bacterium SD302]
MLKKILLPAILLAATCACKNTTQPTSGPDPQPTTTPAQDQAAAQQLIQDIFDNVWSGTDTSYVSRYQTEDFVLLEHGEIWTNDTIRNYQLRKLANARPDQDRRLNSFDFFRAEQNGDEIWMAYHNRGHWVNTEGDTTFSMGWLESAVAKRYEEGWKLRMMHSTRLPR